MQMTFKEALIAHLNGENVECKATDTKWGNYVGCFGHISINKLIDFTCAGWKFRIKPKTVMCNGVEVPAPETVAPDHGAAYFLPGVTSEGYALEGRWLGSGWDNRVLGFGLVYLSEKDATERAKAMFITS